MNRNSCFRVLHIRTVRGTGGGPDKTVLKSCQYLSQRGHVAEAFYILDRREDTGRLHRLAEDLCVRMHVAYEDGPISWATVRALGRLLAGQAYNIIETHEYKSNALAQCFRAGARRAIIATAHGYNRTTKREVFYYGIERLLLRHVDAVVAPTRDMYELLRHRGVPRKRLHVIPNGIETTGRARPARVGDGGERCLLYLGRLSAEKGVDVLLKAMALLARRGIQAELVIAGEGPERPRLERVVCELGLSGRVRMLGFVSDVMPLLGRAAVLVSPGLTECMPNAVLEAMWAGVPVVATDVGGVGEMIRDGREGVLCLPGRADSLAAAVERVLVDPALADRLADRAYQRVMAEFTFERRMERFLELYDRVLSRPRGAMC